MSEDLFTLHQLFYTGSYEKVISLSTDEFNVNNQSLVDYYKIRSLIILNEFNKAINIANSKSNDITYKVLNKFIEFNKDYKKDEAFEKLINENLNNSIINRLGSLYFIKLNEFNNAIKLLESTKDELDLEKYLILIEIQLQLNESNKAVSILKNIDNKNDEIILNLAESLINSINNGENLRSSLYFFEELAHQYPSLLTLQSLFIINLQLNQLDEAEVLLNQIIELNIDNNDLFANLISYYQLIGNNEKVNEYRNKLIKLDSNHPSVLDYNSKNELFDTIVAQYST